MGGKKKKSKAEIEAERIAKEEEDRKAKIAEEKRLEEERIKREEDEKILKIKQKEFRLDELYRLDEELLKVNKILTLKNEKFLSDSMEKAKTMAWKKYMTCDPKPDATNVADLNTYISIAEEEKVETLMEALEKGDFTEEIVDNLHDVYAESISKIDVEKQESCLYYLGKLRMSTMKKLEMATSILLLTADEYIDEKFNDEIRISECSQKGIRYGLFVNHNPRQKPKKLDYKDTIGISVEVPKQVGGASLAVRFMYLPTDRIPTDELEIQLKLQDRLLLGGLFYIDFLTLPPNSKKVKDWILRPLTKLNDSVEPIVFPLGTNDNDPPEKLSAHVPLKISYQVPDNIVVPRKARICYWDPNISDFTDDYVYETEYVAEERKIKFQCRRAGIFALLQESTIDVPYKNWSIEPVYQLPSEEFDKMTDKIHFIIETYRYKVVILVNETSCSLIEPAIPELKHLLGVTMTAGSILCALSRAGIHLVPRDADAPNAKAPGATKGMTLKTETLNDFVCKEIASCSASFDFTSSKWNSTVGTERCILQIRESSAFMGQNTETADYETLCIETDAISESRNNAPEVGEMPAPGMKCTLINGIEKAEELDFSPSKADPLSWVYLETLLDKKKYKSPESVTRVQNSSINFQNTVYELLKTTKVCSFS